MDRQAGARTETTGSDSRDRRSGPDERPEEHEALPGPAADTVGLDPRNGAVDTAETSRTPPTRPLPGSAELSALAGRSAPALAPEDTVPDSTPGKPGTCSATPRTGSEASRRLAATTLPQLPHPPATRIITIANQKGGVGKTTSTVNLAAALALSGQHVLVLDCDPQGNASTALGVPHHGGVASLYEVLVDSEPLAGVVQASTTLPRLECAPATMHLAGAEIELVPMVAREVRLQRALAEYLNQRSAEGLPRPDYVLIDCPPSLGLLTVNAFVTGTEVLIPIQCEYYALEGLSQLLNNIQLVRRHLNPDLHVSAILLTMYDGRTRLSAQVAEEVRQHFTDTVLGTAVPRSVRISEAPSHAQTVMTYDPGSSGAMCYAAAARELAGRYPGDPDQPATTTKEHAR
ncbi:MAG: hypothetical protein CSA58_06620 [Micrococcales bacterium]|nr:MAG: hypothetical protein CSB46_06115 [Micrococcales bacterium]PIE27038.1 MAG: hypothetical protein CSA58_06620 [Micrococcales bacterium]